ncbi:hypothetical protein VSH64_11095 [Amycolatopsis rhabdoformis]|uniref:Uncharacterized protein n=1 Tax=Amycolatopsis rhabdoformis TaxID=1448059 RepID=A0ABZ1IG11_9PSEU|nr:hypothetical protein [Amycolatopsis rhabdoformis]WSE32648.1 hypothetical protein VSH64_11095 [Amycolatopsis rhabdoformis]
MNGPGGLIRLAQETVSAILAAHERSVLVKPYLPAITDDDRRALAVALCRPWMARLD